MKFYAAKYYTKVDNSRQVSEIGNIEHCKDEMKRAHTAAYIAEAFTQEAKDRKVAIHGMYNMFLLPLELTITQPFDSFNRSFCMKKAPLLMDPHGSVTSLLLVTLANTQVPAMQELTKQILLAGPVMRWHTTHFHPVKEHVF